MLNGKQNGKKLGSSTDRAIFLYGVENSKYLISFLIMARWNAWIMRAYVVALSNLEGLEIADPLVLTFEALNF